MCSEQNTFYTGGYGKKHVFSSFIEVTPCHHNVHNQFKLLLEYRQHWLKTLFYNNFLPSRNTFLTLSSLLYAYWCTTNLNMMFTTWTVGMLEIKVHWLLCVWAWVGQEAKESLKKLNLLPENFISAVFLWCEVLTFVLN